MLHHVCDVAYGAIQLLRTKGGGGDSRKKQTKANKGRGRVARSERSHVKRFHGCKRFFQKWLKIFVRSSCYGINSLAFRGSLLWNSLPSNAKQVHNLEEFKLQLTNLGNIHWTCVVCR